MTLEDVELLKKRKRLEKKPSTEPQFQGNGMTRDESPQALASAKKVNGPVEAVIYSKKPLKIGRLKKDQALDVINCGGKKS